jgi:CBS domain-containing protein
MSLRKLLDREIITCSPSDSARDVARTMMDREIGAIVVVDENRPVGIVTDRDLALRCLVEGIDGAQARVRDLMTESVATVRIDDGISQVIKAMKDHEVRRVPVVDESGLAVGLVSMGDVLQLLVQEMSFLCVPGAPKKAKLRRAV